jgi:hypothetical protein
MRKLFLLLLLALIVFAIVCRNRLYVRDPLGSLSRGGVKESGAQVYINFSNDVLIEDDDPPRYVEVIQHGQHAGVPQEIMCLHWMVCLLDADEATLLLGGKVHAEVMAGRLVQFRDDKGEADVNLR